MGQKKYTLNEYLRAMKKARFKNLMRPFDSNESYKIRMGGRSRDFKLPPLKASELIPLSDHLLEQMYDSLNHVLEDLKSCPSFDWHATYSKFDAFTIAKAYLFNTYNKQGHDIEGNPTLMMAYHEMLSCVADALLEGIPLKQFKEHVKDKKMNQQLNTLATYASLAHPDKSSVQISFLMKEYYVQAFKISFISSEEFEQALLDDLKNPLLDLLIRIQLKEEKAAKRFSFFGKAIQWAQVPKTQDIIEAKHLEAVLKQYQFAIDYVSHLSTDSQKDTINCLKNIPFFETEVRSSLQVEKNAQTILKQLSKKVSESMLTIELNKTSTWLNVDQAFHALAEHSGQHSNKHC